MAVAAFFDLDKTILAKSSSLAFARQLYAGGLLGRSDVLRSGYAQFVYLTSGATHDQMEQMKAQLSDLSKGWPVEQVREIVAQALDEVVEPIVFTEALTLIQRHKDQGHDVIVISSSGTEVVEPICDRLGVDRAVGTQMEVGEDGNYTGEILFYAYGEGKAEAIHALADEYDYDLAQCFAYSDSYTDLPMLEVVGNPFAVNPDGELRRVAQERVWPVLTFAKPVAMHDAQVRTERTAAAAAAAAAAAGLGLAWYARYRRGA